MDLKMWMLFLWALSFTDGAQGILAEDSTTLSEAFDPPNRQNDKFSTAEYPYVQTAGNRLGGEHEERVRFGKRCSDRLESALDHIRRRQTAKQKTLELAGYSLHQQLRTAPYDMYVTEMRVRLPTAASWVRVDECRFNPRNASLATRLLFNDLTISGRVNLFDEAAAVQRGAGSPAADLDDSCSMILRLRRAGIGFYTEPIRHERGQFNIKTDSQFLEPGFISVYAYGCEPKLREHRRDFGGEERDDLSKEMEDIFLTGIRSLLTTYMQKELQPAIKETLMRNMGYTISYG